jgi:hypothetical protein
MSSCPLKPGFSGSWVFVIASSYFAARKGLVNLIWVAICEPAITTPPKESLR